MIVKKLIWLSEGEAELLVSDGHYECIAFSHPCVVNEGDILIEPLYAFITKDLKYSYETECSVTLTRLNGLAQKFVCEVVDPEIGLVKIGDINIMLESKTPIGIQAGNLVEFWCARMDVYS